MKRPMLPEIDSKIENATPEEYQCYKKLRQLEEDIDSHIKIKRRELDALIRSVPKTAKRALKVVVYHTYKPPVMPGQDGQWTLRLEGKIDDGNPLPKRFSSFFRKIIVELDNQIYADNIVEWTCFRYAAETDGFVLTRAGHVPHTVQIKLLRNYSPERLVVSEPLFKVIGRYLGDKNQETRQNIILAVWQYIKDHDLMKENDCRVVANDAALRKVFDCDSMAFSSILSRLENHLQPLQPITLQYHLSLNSNSDNVLIDEQLFDVEIDCEENIDRLRVDCLEKSEKLHEESKVVLKHYDERICDIISRLNQLSHEREWFHYFCTNPAALVKDIITSQTNDLSILQADHEADVAVDNAEYFKQQWVNDAMNSIWGSS